MVSYIRKELNREMRKAMPTMIRLMWKLHKLTKKR